MFSSKSKNSSSTARLAIAALLATFLVATPWAQSPAQAADPTPNNGTCDLVTVSSNVFSITTALELWEVTDCVATDGGNNTFRLNNDIDLTGEAVAPTSSPIGSSTSGALSFSGTLDGSDGAGGNREIRGISITGDSGGTGDRYSGLFGLIENAEIRNVTLKGMVNSNAQVGTGSIAGRSEGVVTLSSVVSEVTVTSDGETGGFIGRLGANAQLSIFGSENKGPVTGDGRTGGLTGQAGDGSNLLIQYSTNSGAITGVADAPVGGIVGLLDSNSVATFSNVSNTTPVLTTAVDDNAAGGLIGLSNGRLYVGSSQNSGDVTSNTTRVIGTGGLAGQVTLDSILSIESFLNTGDVTADDYVGGLVGLSEGTSEGSTLSIVDSENSGVIAGSSRVGGLVGFAIRPVSISESRNGATVSGTSDYVGGLVGMSRQLTITSSSNEGAVGGNSKVGGMVGQSRQLTVTKSFNAGQISGDQYVAGLAGEVNGSAQFDEVFNSGDVSTNAAGEDAAAGFVATMYDNGPGFDVTINNSYNSGQISAEYSIGLAMFGDQITVSDAYNVGETSTDGLVAFFQQVNLISTYTNQTPSSEQSPSTDEQLQQKATYVDWDFNDVWGFVCGTNNNFPVLRFANPTATAEDCGPLGGDTGSGSTPAPAPTYTGPTLVSQVQPVAAGSSVTFAGSKLDVVTKAMIGTTEVQITSQTATSLTITVPATLAAATYDLVLFSSFGTLSVMGAITIAGAQAESVSQAQLLGWSWTLKFVGNSRSLSPAQDSHLRARVLAQPNATTVICWGYTTASSPNAWAIAHATQRAQAACNLVAAANSEVKTVVRLRYGVEKSSAMRSAVQFWR